jgi:hypothetical protein
MKISVPLMQIGVPESVESRGLGTVVWQADVGFSIFWIFGSFNI